MSERPFDKLSEWSLARVRWHIEARPEQIFPEDDDWDIAFFMAGRGTGKTRTGAEDISEYARTHRDVRLAFVGPTQADVRDTMIEGESGLLSILPVTALRGGSRDDAWNRSMAELYFANGAMLKGYSSEKPDRLRGPQHHRAWVDEPGAFRDAHRGDVLDTTWNNLMLGLRLGERPRAVVTGTPKRVKLVRDLLKMPQERLPKKPRLHLVKGTTYDNLANLAPTFRATILSQYEGTTIGRQELLGEYIEDVDGALWTQANIDRDRADLTWTEVLYASSRAVVAIDPAGTARDDSDETGIIAASRVDHRCPVCGPIDKPHAFVLADRSGQYHPEHWARRAVDLYDEVEGDRIVGETNFGAEMVEYTVRTIDAGVPFKSVSASRGKRLRAEPIAALYEQGRVHHVGVLPVPMMPRRSLEAQMTEWTLDSGESPDRLDALVWALTDLMLGEERGKLRYRGAA